MRVSLQWLQELVDCDPDFLAPESLAERLSVAGFEVESIDDLAAQAAGVVVGRVLSREYWVAASQSYDPVQVEVLLSSGIDAVGASAPTRALTSRIVGSLPSSGAISNL